jgi:hypothetical protein
MNQFVRGVGRRGFGGFGIGGALAAAALAACGSGDGSSASPNPFSSNAATGSPAPAGAADAGASDDAIAPGARDASTGAPPYPAEVQDPAGEVYWTAFNAGNYAGIGGVQNALTSSLASNEDAYVRRLLGVSYFWRLAESARDPSFSLLDLGMAAPSGILQLKQAKSENPNDPWLPCFLGLFEYAMGRTLGDARSKSDGLGELDRGIALFPQFNTYCRALATAEGAPSSAEFQGTIRDYWAVIAMCDGSITAYHPAAADPAPMAACLEFRRVPHGYNGFWLTAGDVFTKNNQKDIARAFYGNAKLADYDDWGFRAALEQRLAAVDANAALYADGDPSNDPPLSFRTDHSCVMCHQK